MIKEFNKERVDRFWNGDDKSKAWLRGYLEANCSFGIYISPTIKNKKPIVTIKPSIKIIIKDNETINYIKDQLELETNITKEKQTYKSKTYTTDKLHLQKNVDIDKIIELFKNDKFISKNKQGIFDRFCIAYFEILKLGKSWKEYDKKLEDYINKYLPIQKRDNYSKIWIDKIKVHFMGEEE